MYLCVSRLWVGIKKLLLLIDAAKQVPVITRVAVFIEAFISGFRQLVCFVIAH